MNSNIKCKIITKINNLISNISNLRFNSNSNRLKYETHYFTRIESVKFGEKQRVNP